MPLTDIAIRNAKPRYKAYKLYDGGGLYLGIQPNGGKWWRYEYRFDGKRKLLALGTYPDVGLADVRDRHAEARKTLAAGNDPSQAKQEASAIQAKAHSNRGKKHAKKAADKHTKKYGND